MMNEMKRLARTIAALAPALIIASLAAQEPKPVPKDSVRVFVPGCSKGYVFTAGRPAEDSPGTPIPEGTHLRMNGKKDLMADIKGHEGSMIEITGIVKKGQILDEGVRVGSVRIKPGTSGPSSPLGGGVQVSGSSYVSIDVEGWRRIPGECRTR